MKSDLSGRTLVISGGSRGIGLAIAVRAARDGANVVLIAKTDQPDPRLQGTIHTAAAAIERAGGQALAVVGDVRSDVVISSAVEQAVERFGGIDVCVNNASVLNLSSTLDLSPSRYDLMQDVNTRATFMLTRACLPHLLVSNNPHVLTLSPPLNLSPRWMGAHVGYTIAKYGMSLATLGFASEFTEDGLAANCLWPRTLIATDAVANLLGGDQAVARARSPQIMADAAYAVLTTPSRERSGQLLVDEDVLNELGYANLSGYSVTGSDANLQTDIFLD